MDDVLLSGRHTGELTELVRKLRLKFAMKDLGPARHILGMKISRNHAKRQLFLSQTDYSGRVLERFNMQSAKSASTPLPIHLWLSQRDCTTSGSEREDMKSIPYAPVVGSLMYAMVATRPDISHAVGVISRFMHNPGVGFLRPCVWKGDGTTGVLDRRARERKGQREIRLHREPITTEDRWLHRVTALQTQRARTENDTDGNDNE